MREWLRSVFCVERRKKKWPVIVERRQRVAMRAADKHLSDSIDRFAAVTARAVEQMK